MTRNRDLGELESTRVIEYLPKRPNRCKQDRLRFSIQPESCASAVFWTAFNTLTPGRHVDGRTNVYPAGSLAECLDNAPSLEHSTALLYWGHCFITPPQAGLEAREGRSALFGDRICWDLGPGDPVREKMESWVRV